MIADWLNHELHNWSRWLWSGDWPHPLPPDHAASAEGRYINPSDLYAEREPPRPIAANRERAEIVERAFRERMSKREQDVIAAEYPRRFQSGRYRYGQAGAARRLRISLHMYEAALRSAVRQVEVAFEGTR